MLNVALTDKQADRQLQTDRHKVMHNESSCTGGKNPLLAPYVIIYVVFMFGGYVEITFDFMLECL